MNNKFSLGFISEIIFLNIPVEIESSINEKDEFEDIIDFCIDAEGNVRKSTGMVSFDENSYKNKEYVPHKRFDVNLSPWTSHHIYFEIELPNPFENFEYSKKIRQAFIDELNFRLSKKIKNAKARISRQNQ